MSLPPPAGKPTKPANLPVWFHYLMGGLMGVSIGLYIERSSDRDPPILNDVGVIAYNECLLGLTDVNWGRTVQDKYRRCRLYGVTVMLKGATP